VLYVAGLTAGKPWSVYKLAGMLIYRAVAADDGVGRVVETGRALSLPKGVYIVVSGTERVKVE